MSDFFSEINTIMNYFALVDNCQNNNHSTKFCISAMPKLEHLIKTELQYRQTRELFADLEKMFLNSKTLQIKSKGVN